jgi:hypothetical protein
MVEPEVVAGGKAFMLEPEIVAAIVSSIVALTIAFLSHQLQKAQLRQELELHKDKVREELKLEFATEAGIRALLSTDKWKLRTFKAIHGRFKGLEADELRKFLIRAGALSYVRKEDDEELWGLRDHNKDQDDAGV